MNMSMSTYEYLPYLGTHQIYLIMYEYYVLYACKVKFKLAAPTP